MGFLLVLLRVKGRGRSATRRLPLHGTSPRGSGESGRRAGRPMWAGRAGEEHRARCRACSTSSTGRLRSAEEEAEAKSEMSRGENRNGSEPELGLLRSEDV